MIRAGLVAVSLMGVVDRVEGDLTIVEWSTGEWSDIPQALWTAPPLEGDHMTLTLRSRGSSGTPARTGHDSRLLTVHGTLELPESCHLGPNEAYQLRIRARQRVSLLRRERPCGAMERLSDVDRRSVPVELPSADTAMSTGDRSLELPPPAPGREPHGGLRSLAAGPFQAHACPVSGSAPSLVHPPTPPLR